jgi:large conductance mechanosensitive channel
VLKGFRDFILRGNVVDMAVGIIIGAAFNGIVNALVAGVINPLIASTIHKPDFSGVVLTINGGHIKVGDVLNAGISFFIIAATVYFGIVLPMSFFLNKMKKQSPTPPPPPATKICPECMSEIPLAAKRCAHCGQPQPPVGEPEQVAAGQAG